MASKELDKEYMSARHTNEYRTEAFRHLLYLTVARGLFFSFINIQEERFLVAVLDFSFVLIALLVLLLYFKVGFSCLKYIIRVYLLFFYTAVLAALLLVPSLSLTLFAWIFVIPPLSYLLLGRMWGRSYTAGYVLLEFGILLFRNHQENIANSFLFFSTLGFCLVAVWLLINLYEKTQETFRNKLINLAIKDALTGFYNRTVLEKKYTQALTCSTQKNSVLTLAIINIDWFRLINENYGYEEGNKVICLIADLIRTRTRDGDFALRLGDEEFCLLLPCTPLYQGFELIEQIRALIIENLSYYGENNMFITASIGVAECTQETTLSDALIIADKRLYKARQQGFNQTVCSDE